MGSRPVLRLVLTASFILLVWGCTAETSSKGSIGAPTKTVQQANEKYQGYGIGGGDFIPREMPAAAKRNSVEADPRAEGQADYYRTLQRGRL